MAQYPAGSGYMGGNPGDGFAPSMPVSYSSVPAGPSVPTQVQNSIMSSSQPIPNQTTAQPNQAVVQPNQTTMQYSQPVVQPGSITQYAPQAAAYAASPPVAQRPTSYAERSAQLLAASGATVPSAVIPSAVPSMPPPAPMPPAPTPVSSTANQVTASHSSMKGLDNAAVQAQQNRMLTEATRKVQEHAYYMRQAMDRDELPNVLDRASRMLGELGDHHHHHHHHHHHGHSSYSPQRHENGSPASQLTPKNYYELHMRVLDDVPNLEEYLLNLSQSNVGNDAGPRYTMKEMYEASQYAPRALPRLYLQICAGSALVRSKEVGAKWLLNDLIESVKCVQCPLRGLFLRQYLLQALRDKLPDSPPSQAETEAASLDATASTEQPQRDPEMDPGTVKDSYEFVLSNFIEMNKLWVRIQHLPGDGKSKEQRKRRERERNELRILVGTNLVRISQLEGVTSKIYGEIILPKILEQIVTCRDPLAQAYLIDCIIQVFPDEYHIETLPILLGVCPKLREKVNIRTILQSLMDRLANYYADEELLDETDTNEVKKAMAQDSFIMFEECVQNVYNARGPHLTSKEVIRLQTALLNFSLKCYPGKLEQINKCLGVCVEALHQAGGGGDYSSQPEDTGVHAQATDPNHIRKNLDEVSIKELEKLLSVPLDSLALRVLELDHYSGLLEFLPWASRRDVALKLVKAVTDSGEAPRDVKQIDMLFQIIAPVIRDENTHAPTVTGQDNVERTSTLLAGLGVDTSTPMSFGASFNETDQHSEKQEENNMVCRLIHLIDSSDTDVAFEMLNVARKHLALGGKYRIGQTMVPLVFSALRLVTRVYALEFPSSAKKNPEVDEGSSKKAEPKNKPEGEAEEASNNETQESKQEEADKELAPETSAIPEEPETQQEENTKGSCEDTKASEENVDNNEVEIKKEDDQKDETSSKSEKAATDVSFAPENAAKEATPKPFSKSVSCRKIFVFLQNTVSILAKGNPEVALKLYLQVAIAADSFADVDENGGLRNREFAVMTYELITQAFILHEDEVSDSKAQQRCIVSMVGTLLACDSIANDDYENLITKTAQYAAKILKKPEQCRMVALCARLFFRGEAGDAHAYQNPQRVLECLQRGLKLADACTTTSPSNVGLFVDLLDHYVFFFQKGLPNIQDKYISGLIALITEHMNTIDSFAGSNSTAVADAKAHFRGVVQYISAQKEDNGTKTKFSSIDCDVSLK